MIDQNTIALSGRFVKTAKLRDEYYVSLDSPEDFIAAVRSSDIRADLLTFVQAINDTTPRYSFYMEHDNLAVLPLTTYDTWFNQQITSKARNKIRKAPKNGVEVRQVEFNEELVHAIMNIYNENPIRQGQRNKHYGKSLDTVRREHSTFLERSDFIGAYHNEQLIGFAKITHVNDCSLFMNILSMISQREKAPTNALLAKTVESCASRSSRFLNYSTWGSGEGLNEFKEANGFKPFEIPRYFVPLTRKVMIALKLKLHRKPTEWIPSQWINKAATLRSKWLQYQFRHSSLL